MITFNNQHINEFQLEIKFLKFVMAFHLKSVGRNKGKGSADWENRFGKMNYNQKKTKKTFN